MNIEQLTTSLRNKGNIALADEFGVTAHLKHPIYTTEIVLALDSKPK